MIVAAIKDRLGNQMFQYAAGKGLAAKKNTCLKIDKRYFDYSAPKGFSYELDAFAFQQNFATDKEIKEYTGLSNSGFHKVIRKFFPRHQATNPNYIYDERYFQYDSNLENLGSNVYMRGYWQSYKYFADIEHELRKDFEFKIPVDVENDVFAQQMKQSNSVCLSVRRGEHLTNPSIGNKYFQCDINYYKNGLEVISRKVKNIKLFVFSDDIDWCIQNLKFDYETVFVKHQFALPRVDYYLQLMALCKHFVIPVSTFPWWGAWLSTHADKMVIVPRIWFTDLSININDLFPENWIKI